MFFIISASWSRLVTPSFKTLTTDVQNNEALYRDSNNRLFEYVEEITLLNGQQSETENIKSIYEQLKKSINGLNLQVLFASTLDTYSVRYMVIFFYYYYYSFN